MQPQEVDYVIYHGGCPDGVGSALAAWTYSDGQGITYFGAEIGKPPPSDLRGKYLLICDFSYDEQTLRRLISECKSLLVIDHHKTSEAALRAIPDEYKRFDMKRSGAGLTWEYFFPGKAQPRLIQYIEDNDIWSKKLPQTDLVFAWLQLQERTIQSFAGYLDDSVFDAVIATEGSVVAKVEAFQLEEALKYVETALLKLDDRYYLVAYTNFPILKSTLGNRMLQEFPAVDFTAVYTIYADKIGFSLRSDDRHVDVTVVGQKMAGKDSGGHRNAAGMKIPLTAGLFPVKKINVPYNLLKEVRRSPEETSVLLLPQKGVVPELVDWLLQERWPGSGIQNGAFLQPGETIKKILIV